MADHPHRSVWFLTPWLLLGAASVVAQSEGSGSEVPDCDLPSGGGTSYVFVVDASGSMNDNGRLASVKQAAQGLVAQMGSEDEVALFTFQDCRVDMRLAFTPDKAQFLDVLQAVSASGSTSLALGIEQGGGYLLQRAANGRKSLVVLTDGEESCDGNPEMAAARFREQLALANAAGGPAGDPPTIEEIRFVNAAGEALDEVRVGDEFKVLVSMSSSPSRCVDKETLTLEFNRAGDGAAESFSVVVVETGPWTGEFESEVFAIAGQSAARDEP